ncbi:IclR family transcriptional regulator [Teichococcus aestuarii]|uniref:IclR family transcriptional regulator n=1 Tax=Teichococcus aestuarii TaxID=568898 RepID=UPI0011B1F8BD|nr:IclR family transcriptional regulator [Pseudoroseomonas aestuarii]
MPPKPSASRPRRSPAPAGAPSAEAPATKAPAAKAPAAKAPVVLAASRSAVRLVYDQEDVSADYASDRRFVWALARGMEVLRAFEPGRGPLGVGEIAALTGLPKPTVSRLTYTLAELGYLRVLHKQGRYEPAPALLALGYPVLANLRVRQAAHDHMRQLAQETGTAVGLASRDRLSMIYVENTASSALATLRLGIGSRVEMARSALGRAFLAALGETERDYLLERLARRYGAAWAELKPRVLDGIAQVQARGFCIVDGEWQPDVRTAGAPLVSLDGTTIMAMNIGAPGYMLDQARLEKELGPRIAHLSRMVAPLLGF